MSGILSSIDYGLVLGMRTFVLCPEHIFAATGSPAMVELEK